MMEAGKEIQDRDMEYRFGLMVLNTKEAGIIIKQMEKENLHMLMEMCTMDSG